MVLVSLESWSVWAFILLLLLALALFVAGTLVLPTGAGVYPEDLEEYFEKDGRWGMAVVAIFCVTGIIANALLFNVPLFGSMNIWNAIAIGLIAILIMTKRRAVLRAVTFVYGVWLGIYLWTFVPATY
jgi:hypothetical protein